MSLSLSSSEVEEDDSATTISVTAELPENSTSYPADKAITVAVGGGHGDRGDGLRYGSRLHDNPERGERERYGHVQHRPYGGHA